MKLDSRKVKCSYFITYTRKDTKNTRVIQQTMKPVTMVTKSLISDKINHRLF